MDIKLCMGSSCFARGNAENLAFIEKYIKDNKLEAKVEICGCLCEGKCSEGPNVTLNGKRYTNVNIAKIKKAFAKIENGEK